MIRRTIIARGVSRSGISLERANVARQVLFFSTINSATTQRASTPSQSPLQTSSLGTSVRNSAPTITVMPVAIPSAFPPWSISPSPLRNTSKSNPNTAGIVAGIVGGFLLLAILTAAFFTRRRRLSLSWKKKSNGRWHDMEGKGGGEFALLAATHAPDPHHDTKVVAPSLQDHITYVTRSEGRKPSPFHTPLYRIHDNRRSSPFDPFADPVVRFPSCIHDKGIDYIEMAPNPTAVSQRDPPDDNKEVLEQNLASSFYRKK